MDFVRPPTDNLYKFLAIFGLIACGFSVYFKATAKPKAQEVLANFETALLPKGGVGTEEKYLEFSKPNVTNLELNGYLPPLNFFDPYSKAFEEWDQECDRLLKVYYDGSEPPNIHVMEAYFKRPDVKKYYMKEKTLSAEAFDNMVAGLKVEQWAVETKPERDYCKEQARYIVGLKHAKQSTALYMRQYLDNYRYASNGVLFGLVMMLVGFATWYIKVQRYQDAILRRDANAMRPPKRSRLARPQSLQRRLMALFSQPPTNKSAT